MINRRFTNVKNAGSGDPPPPKALADKPGLQDLSGNRANY
jgi:hypothetical protein